MLTLKMHHVVTVLLASGRHLSVRPNDLTSGKSNVLEDQGQFVLSVSSSWRRC